MTFNSQIIIKLKSIAVKKENIGTSHFPGKDLYFIYLWKMS